MKNFKSLKAAAIYMMVAFVGILSFVSCQPDDVTGHDNNVNNALAVKVKGDSVKPDPKPEDVYRDSSWVSLDNTVIGLDWQYYRNDTLINSDSTKTNVAAKIARDKERVQTTYAHLNNLGITAGQVTESRDGKMNYVFRQAMSDNDGQTYNGLFTSGYATLKDLQNVHGKLVGFQTTGFRNIPQPTPADMDTLVLTRVGWKAIFQIENGKNLAGQNFEIALDSTDHYRYIPKDAPTILYHKPFKYKIPGNWESKWVIGQRYYWSNNTVTADSMFVPLKGSYSKIELKDKIVSSFEYVHEDGSVKWGERYAVTSNDNRIKLYEKKGTKKSYATNGINADQFFTEFAVTVQDAVVMFADSTWTISADEASLTTKRNIFAEATSDMEGYSMVKFVDEEIAKWNGQYAVTLDEQCKLYMKIDTPDPEDPDYDYILVKNSDYKNRTQSEVKVGLEIQQEFEDGTKGSVKSFSMERAESWIWKGDSVIYEGIAFFMQETAEKLELVGELKKTAKTQRDNGGVFSFNEYEGDFRAIVKSNGIVKYTTWHAVWSEDFTFTYTDEKGKTFSHTFDKSDYSVKAQNSSLKKNESKSSVTSEVYDYSVDGIFAIDNVNRSAYGYGRFQKAIEETVTEYWDKFDFEKDAKEYTDRVEYFLRWIKESSTGKKTTQDIKIILKRSVEGSTYTITVEDPEREIGTQSESTSYVARSESVGDINVSYDWLTSTFELPNVFDGKTTKKDIATFVDPTNVKVTKKNSKGEDVTIDLPSFEHQLTSTVSDLEKVSETEELVSYTYTRIWNWASTQCTTSAKSIGNINKIPEHGGGEPDFDLTVSKYFAAVCRPSNRNAPDITAYTCLLVDEEAMKCLGIGFYNGIVTMGEVEDYIPGMNSACYVKDQNKVVATTCTLANGIIKYKDGNGNVVDAGTFIQWQGAGFNDRGNDWLNWTGQYIPYATNQGGVCVVGFSGSPKTITVTGWKVQ